MEIPISGLSSESYTALNVIKGFFDHYYAPISRESIYQKFYKLKTKWENETKLVSSTTEMVLHPSYQEIIGLGRSVLPYILNDLKENRNHWFWALKSITGCDPIPQEHIGNIRKMAEVWVQWGINEKII